MNYIRLSGVTFLLLSATVGLQGAGKNDGAGPVKSGGKNSVRAPVQPAAAATVAAAAVQAADKRDDDERLRQILTVQHGAAYELAALRGDQTHNLRVNTPVTMTSPVPSQDLIEFGSSRIQVIDRGYSPVTDHLRRLKLGVQMVDLTRGLTGASGEELKLLKMSMTRRLEAAKQLALAAQEQAEKLEAALQDAPVAPAPTAPVANPASSATAATATAAATKTVAMTE